jgi:hypothetical protein
MDGQSCGAGQRTQHGADAGLVDSAAQANTSAVDVDLDGGREVSVSLSEVFVDVAISKLT